MISRCVQLQLSPGQDGSQATGHGNSSLRPIGFRPDILLVVYGVVLLETLQTALSAADLYYWFITGFGNIEHLRTPYASSFDVPIIGAVVSLSVQFFFVYRIWALGKKEKETWWLCLIICLVTFVPKVRGLRMILSFLHSPPLSTL